MREANSTKHYRCQIQDLKISDPRDLDFPLQESYQRGCLAPMPVVAPLLVHDRPFTLKSPFLRHDYAIHPFSYHVGGIIIIASNNGAVTGFIGRVFSYQWVLLWGKPLGDSSVRHSVAQSLECPPLTW